VAGIDQLDGADRCREAECSSVKVLPNSPP
jgi:hypothetical protein